MKSAIRPHRIWPVSEGPAIRPGLWLLATAVVGILLVEVWQSAHVAELCLTRDHTRAALVELSARVDFVRADLERRTTRAELAPVASRMGLQPADPQQVVHLPSEYLADGGSTPRGDRPVTVLTWAEGVSRALVPEATARSRAGN
jgi:hypothetical protein